MVAVSSHLDQEVRSKLDVNHNASQNLEPNPQRGCVQP